MFLDAVRDGAMSGENVCDYDGVVPLLAADAAGQDEKLYVEVFYAESDIMIGSTTGPAWFDQCWNLGRRGPMIDYRRCEVAGSGS